MLMNDVMGNSNSCPQGSSFRERQSPDWRVLTDANREIGVPGVSGRRITVTFWFFEKFEFGESAESSEATYLRACSVRFVFFECEFESCGASASAEELFL